MEIKGTIKLIKPTQTFGSNGFQKREFVVTTDEQYPQYLLIEFIQDRCSLLDMFQANQEVKVNINLRGREWTAPDGEVKYFNTLQAWKIEAINSQNNIAPPPQKDLSWLEDDDSSDHNVLPF